MCSSDLLRSSLATNAKQSSNNDTVVKKFSTAWDIIGDIHEDLVVKMGKVPALEGSNGTNLSVLPELGQVLSAGADAIVQDMNGKYGDNFIFGGADTLKVPFEMKDGKLFYRGKEVDAMKPSVDPPDPAANTYENIDDKLYVDVGLGFQEGQNGGGIISSSAYDSALNGLDFLGYGTDGEGLPNNVVSIMKELGGMFQRYDTKNNTWGNGDSAEKAQKLMNKLEQASDRLNKAHVELDAKTTFLKTNQDRLTATGDNLNEQVVNVEDVDPAHILDDHVRALLDGDLDVAGGELEVHLLHPPVEVHLVHLVADVHFSPFPADLRGGGGQKLHVHVHVPAHVGRGGGDLVHDVLTQLGLHHHPALAGIGGGGLVDGLVPFLGRLADAGGHSRQDGVARLKGIQIHADGAAFDLQSPFVPGDFHLCCATGIFQLGVGQLHFDFYGYGLDLNERIQGRSLLSKFILPAAACFFSSCSPAATGE